MVAEEVWQVNQGLREAVLSLQRRSEEHEKVERELRIRETYFQRRCEDLERSLSEKIGQLEEEIQNRKTAEEMLRHAQEDFEKNGQDGKNPSTSPPTAALFAHEVANSLNGIFACLQLLDMKAQDQGGGDPELKSLVGSATDEIIAEDRLRFESNDVRLKCEFSDTLPLMMLDQEKIKQAILSICQNAVEAMPSGGVLTLRGYQSESKIFLEISDTGAGVAEGLEVFEPFHTTKQRRSGLGLPIVGQIISGHNGTIEYASNPGQGTTFKIGLPAGRP